MRLSNLKNLVLLSRLKKLKKDFIHPYQALVACSGLFKKTFYLQTKNTAILKTNRHDLPIWNEYFSAKNALIKIEHGLFSVNPHNKKHPPYTIEGANHCLTYKPKRWRESHHLLIKKLEQSEKMVFSQHGEDGILETLLGFLPETKNYIVEFGAYDGICMSNSRYWIKNKGWSAFLIEADNRFYRNLEKLYKNHPRVTIKNSFVTPKNINTLFDQAHVPTDFDILSIDIDSIDYQVWEALTNFKPKIVVIEYNGMLPPDTEYVMPEHKANMHCEAAEVGASILSLYNLGKQKGYHLAYADLSGTNLFFIHNSYLEYIDCAGITPDEIYQPPQYGVIAGGIAPNGRGYV